MFILLKTLHAERFLLSEDDESLADTLFRDRLSFGSLIYDLLHLTRYMDTKYSIIEGITKNHGAACVLVYFYAIF